jgi:hypothetical protein
LDRGDIRPDYFGAGVLVCHVDAPDSGSGADVEDALWVRSDRGVEEAVAHSAQEDFVVEA